MAVGYTNNTNVANFLGITLTSAQQTQATYLLDPVEDTINRITRRQWQPTNLVITSEPYDLVRDWVYLKTTPVASIQSVVVRTRAIADPGVTLVQNTDYELQNATTGFVVFTSGYGDPGEDEALDQYTDHADTGGQTPILSIGAAYSVARAYALISYTATIRIPKSIEHAATMLIAHWMGFTLDPNRYGLSRAQVEQRAYSYSPDDIPAGVMQLLTGIGHRRVVFG